MRLSWVLCNVWKFVLVIIWLTHHRLLDKQTHKDAVKNKCSEKHYRLIKRGRLVWESSAIKISKRASWNFYVQSADDKQIKAGAADNDGVGIILTTLMQNTRLRHAFWVLNNGINTIQLITAFKMFSHILCMKCKEVRHQKNPRSQLFSMNVSLHVFSKSWHLLLKEGESEP